MIILVPLDDFKAVVRVYDEEQDDYLSDLLNASTFAVLAYLKSGADSWYDPATGLLTGPMPHAVKMAILYLAARYYREPDGDEGKDFGQGQLPYFVTAILYPLRDPALA